MQALCCNCHQPYRAVSCRKLYYPWCARHPEAETHPCKQASKTQRQACGKRTLIADGQDLGLVAAAGAPIAEYGAAHQQPQAQDAATHALPIRALSPENRARLLTFNTRLPERHMSPRAMRPGPSMQLRCWCASAHFLSVNRASRHTACLALHSIAGGYGVPSCSLGARESSGPMGCRSMCAPAREYLQRVAVHQAHGGHRKARADRQDGPRLASGRVPDDYPVERPQRLQRQRQAPADAVLL